MTHSPQFTFHETPSPEKSIVPFLSTSGIIIDVRSPVEFADGSIPESVNIPLFTNEERATIGTVYKQFGRQTSIHLGYEIVAPGMEAFFRRFCDYKHRAPIGVLCARGGMRSTSVVNFLHSKKIPAYRLAGGFKYYRRHVLRSLENCSFSGGVYVIHGYTGAGKTQLLEKLPNTVCYESIANHRNSLFGGIGLEKVSQKNFEARLCRRLDTLHDAQPVIFEGEGGKIGDIYLPTRLTGQINAGEHIFLDTPFDVRLKNTLQNYGLYIKNHGDVFRKTIQALGHFLSAAVVETILGAFNRGDYETVTAILLQKYYDKKYGFGYAKYNFMLTVDGSNLDDAAECILSCIQTHRKCPV